MECNQFEGWLKENLVCPQDHKRLTRSDNSILVCEFGHKYPIINGIPVMLLENRTSTQPEIFSATIDMVKSFQKFCEVSQKHSDSDYNIESSVDPFVQKVISATSGQMYRKKIPRYPIPHWLT